MIKVLICDDHAIVRKGLREIVSEADDVSVVGEAGDGDELLGLVSGREWDVVLLDIAMPKRDGLDLLGQLKASYPQLPVLMLSMYPESQYAVRALKAGAAGYVTKDSAPDDLLEAIRRAAQGRRFVSADLAEHLAEGVGRGQPLEIHESLSDREFQVLCLIASGKTVSQIAEELSLSVKTVSTHRARMLGKMKMRNNAEVTYYAIKRGLVE